MPPANPTHCAQRRIVLLLAPLCAWALAIAWRCPDVSHPPVRGLQSDQLLSAVNPNTAPWWELTVLPRVGEVTAKRIVAHREAANSAPAAQARRGRVFAAPADLERVHGIGPKTARRAAPYLTFKRPNRSGTGEDEPPTNN
ncbi:MAG: helix-hairpin-helix domain-containing protein [Phycisphaerales bacterium]|nr:MAG: helix-hairpin-helix domain-containing protein [Phycisphaerales bacterium]